MSARTRLALSYVAFLLVACVGLTVLFASVLAFLPVGNISWNGSFVPDRDDLLRVLWPRLLAGLALVLALGAGGGWYLAGRVLRPLRRMHAVAQQVAAGSLEHRVDLQGQRDEFRDLSESFDSMLDRLQDSFAEQQRFAANASHELRTPHAVMRSMIEVAAADPHSVDLPRLLARLHETNRRGEEVVEALLVLSRMDQARLPTPVPVDVAEVCEQVMRDVAPEAASAGIEVRAVLGEGDVDGNAVLLRQMISNLVRNAVRHNTGSGGSVEVLTHSEDDGTVELRVANTGPVLDPQQLKVLQEPFVRGAGRATSGVAGSGLGLTIVTRVAAVHGAELVLSAPPAGGMQVRITFPAP